MSANSAASCSDISRTTAGTSDKPAIREARQRLSPRDQLIPASGQRAYQQRLDHPMLSDGRREIRKSGIVELLAGLPPIGLDIRDR